MTLLSEATLTKSKIWRERDEHYFCDINQGRGPSLAMDGKGQGHTRKITNPRWICKERCPSKTLAKIGDYMMGGNAHLKGLDNRIVHEGGFDGRPEP